MDEIAEFSKLVLIVAGGFTLALAATKLTVRIPLPAPAIFLLAAALASDLFAGLDGYLSIRDVERIGVVALIVILLDGGMRIGWRRFQVAAGPIALLGVLGSFATAGIVAVAAHQLLGFDWTSAGILGAALAPTDPAVLFSVLGNREVGGRSGTILEGESGTNDPVGIALMIGMLELATSDHGSFWLVVEEFAKQMTIGLAVGVAGALVLLPLLRRISLPSESLYPLRVLLGGALIYAAASLAHGSGFLAVFVAGILLGDSQIPFQQEVERFHGALASLAEIVVFVALGLTIDLRSLGTSSLWLDGLLMAAVLAFVARPLAVWPLLLPTRLRPGEKLFIVWGGLRGAVPILLAAFALLAQVDQAEQIYDIVFVVVAFSAVVQGLSMPSLASRLGVPMRRLPPVSLAGYDKLRARP